MKKVERLKGKHMNENKNKKHHFKRIRDCLRSDALYQPALSVDTCSGCLAFQPFNFSTFQLSFT